MWKKIQLKTVCKRASTGFRTRLQVSGGRDENSQQMYDFYSLGAADYYVCVLHPNARGGNNTELHVWDFSEKDLYTRGYLYDKKTECGGITSLTVHMPSKYTKERPDERRNFSLWTKQHHSYYMVK